MPNKTRADTTLETYARKKWNRDFSSMEEKVVSSLYSFYQRRKEFPAVAHLKEFMVKEGKCGVNTDVHARVTDLVNAEVLKYGEKIETGQNSVGRRVLPNA